MRTIILGGAISLALVFGTRASFAQSKEVKCVEDAAVKDEAEENRILYEDALHSGQVKKAEAPLNWLLTNEPQLHSSLYTSAEEIFDKLASQEKDPTRKKIYVDSLMVIYDLHVVNCDDDASVLNRKALSYLRYYSDKPAQALTLLDKVFELNGDNVLDATLVPYMQTVKLNALKFKNLTDDQILKRYDRAMRAVDAKINRAQLEAKPVEPYKKIKDDIDAVLISIVTVDCEFVKKSLEPRFKQNPSDLTLARKIFSFLLQGRCTDDPLWLDVGETIYKSSPEKDFGLARNLGLKYYSTGNFVKAEWFLKEAVSRTSNVREKAEILIYLGQIQANTDKPAARALYLQALEVDPGNKEAYEKIGDL